MTKVWITNVAGHDFSEANKYGDELISITKGKINVFNTVQLVEEFKLTLHNYSQEDYLLLSGNVIVNVLASIILLEKFQTIKILIFDAVNKTYVPRELNLNQIRGD